MLKQRTIFFFWLPLAFSWLLMTFEGPWVQGVISRKPDAELQLAAFGLVLSLIVTIQSPVIMLLATSSALSRDRQAFRVLWRFMMGINVFVTLVATLMAFTPLLDLYLGRLLGIPQDIIDATRPGVAVMILWPAFIGFRRFYQGVLINHNHTRAVGMGSVIRVGVSGGLAVLFGVLTQLPGAVIGAAALVSAVGSEAVYAYFASRQDVRDVLNTPRPPGKKPLTYRDALRFHLPLAFTSFLTLMVRPVIESGLANAGNARAALAAWAVIFSLFLVMRSGGLAWQEVVIALSRGPGQLRAVRRFTWLLGWGTSGLMALIAFTPLIDLYLGPILNIPESIRALVVIGARFGLLLPLLTAVQSYLRALLMLSDNTNPIYQGMGIGFGVTALTMFGGVALGLPGIPMASLAMTIGLVVETVYIWRGVQRNTPALRQHWQHQAAASPAGD